LGSIDLNWFDEGGSMGTLRKQMTEAMKLRRFSPRTQQSYLAAITGLARHYRTPPDQLDFEKIKAYLLYMTVDRGLSWSTCNVAVSAFRFFYSEVLGWEKASLPIPSGKKPKTLPVLLSRQEIERLFACAGGTRNRVLLMTTYAAGLRVSEVVNLKPADIDSHRLMIRVEQAKGAKDRYSILSPRLLAELRSYWQLLPAHHLALPQQ
jgi:integrase/recombinase XerD